jgi:RNA polymerase sigma factor (sigma-70 family)
MDQQSWLTERFEENRPRLRGVAYRLLGSLSEAEDAVQEAWLRLNRIDTATVDNLGAWLTTVVSRVCLNMLRSRRLRREEPIGAQISEPSVDRGEGADPEGEAVLADSVGVALLVVLDTLTPAERLAFVLHDLFAMPFEEIGRIAGRSPSRSPEGGDSYSRRSSMDRSN